jgi:hypothetical protein
MEKKMLTLTQNATPLVKESEFHWGHPPYVVIEFECVIPHDLAYKSKYDALTCL